ncbi:MAG: NAD-dependent epimerase/dehydratase family protein [Stygiobacter sp.]|nr:MAG: NAD-dependent epimerase/dehydratase family protein [Stygiobacter sp.]
MVNYYKNKNVLITGGLGFIGSNLTHKLIELGANVSIIDNLNPLYGGNSFNILGKEEKIELVVNDVRDTNVIRPLIVKSDIIFHLAAQVSYIDSLNIPFEDLDLNARATLNILETCRKYNPKSKIIFSSSRMVYGKADKPIITELGETNPLSLYGIHKLTSEKYLLMYYKDFGIPCSILRLTNPYGPRQQVKHSKYSLVGWFIRQAMEDKVIKIYGEGLQLRDYIFVDDIVDAMIKCGETENAIGEIINIGSGTSSKFSDMVHSVVKCVKSGKVEYIPWPENYEKVETGDINVDISKLQKLTSWNPKVTLEEGIHLTYEYYKKYISNYI